MPLSARSCLLTEQSWVDVAEHLARDSRLLVPVGACDQYGPHLPIGAGTLVAEAVAGELARDFDVLQAPTFAFGINLPGARRFPGTAGLHEKTLHRALNDLLAAWEDQGFTEFILITAHRFDPHIDAIATVSAAKARIRAVEILGIDLADLRESEPGPEHGGEVLTSLMLHLYPERVALDRAPDFLLPHPPRGRARPLSVLPADCEGYVGRPSLASADKGRRIYERILQRIRAKIFLAGDADAEAGS